MKLNDRQTVKLLKCMIIIKSKTQKQVEIEFTNYEQKQLFFINGAGCIFSRKINILNENKTVTMCYSVFPRKITTESVIWNVLFHFYYTYQKYLLQKTD